MKAERGVVEFYKNILLQEKITHIDTEFCGSNYCCLGDLGVHTRQKDRREDRQNNGHIDRQANRQTSRQTWLR